MWDRAPERLLKNIGIVPDHRHLTTRNDLLMDNVDLFAAAGDLLAALPVRELSALVTPAAGNTAELNLTTKNLDRIDVFVNQRPQLSIDLETAAAHLVVVKPSSGPALLRLEGYSDGRLAANRVLAI